MASKGRAIYTAKTKTETTPIKNEAPRLIVVEVIQEVRVQISYYVDAVNMNVLNIHGMGATGEIPYSKKNLEQVQTFVKRGLVIIKN